MNIDRKIAQEIVDKSVDIIGYNVNFINKEGIIIASSDKTRINTLHEGAILVLSRNREVLVDEKISKSLKGTKEGINLIVECRNIIVGVIGITGKCDQVEKFGKLIKMNVEMYLEQHILKKEYLKNKLHKEQFLLSLLHGNNNKFNIDLFEIYNTQMNLQLYHTVIIVNIETDNYLKLNKYMKMVINKVVDNVINFYVLEESNNIVYVLTHKNKNNLLETSNQFCINIKNMLNEAHLKNFNIFLGNIYESREGINLSYKSAKELASLNFFGKQIYKASFYENERLFYNIKDCNLSNDYINIWQKLLNNDKNNILIETLITFYNNDLKQKETCEQLFIHRNTLKYRLDKIEAITTKNPKKIRGLVSLIISKNLYERDLKG